MALACNSPNFSSGDNHDGRSQEEEVEIEVAQPRAGAWKLAAPARSVCPRCGQAKTPHTVCPSCGWYKNRVAVDVA